MQTPSFDLHENEPVCGTHFHMNGFARRLVLTLRQKAARKWPIDLGHQHDHCFIVWGHQYGCCDVTWKHHSPRNDFIIWSALKKDQPWSQALSPLPHLALRREPGIEVEEGYSGFGYFLASLLWSLGVQAVEKCVGFLFYIIVDILLANKRDNLFKKRWKAFFG